MKICPKCNTEKETTAFYKQKQSKDGLQCYCKTCQSKTHSSWYITKVDELAKYNANWRKQNPEKEAARCATKKATKLNATPRWLTEQQLNEIKDFYLMAKELETIFPWKQHIDHIVPLKGKDVCGLHVPWNLQIMSAIANIQKGNRYNG